MAIYLTSDLHFGHDRKFLWGPRGFASSLEHDEAVIRNWNAVVGEDDNVYVLGDLMLGDNAHGMECLGQLNGHLHIIFGNHDTNTRQKLYSASPNVVEICGWATALNYRKYHFYLSHFPTLTGNLEKESLHQMTLNLYGHTHQQDKFFEDRPYMYCVGLDANNNTPVLLDSIIENMKEKVKECLDFL